MQAASRMIGPALGEMNVRYLPKSCDVDILIVRRPSINGKAS